MPVATKARGGTQCGPLQRPQPDGGPAEKEPPSSCAAGTACSGKLKVVLCNHSLWLTFHRQQNEMILTKPGRAMFPFLAYQIQGMEPQARYRVFVDILPVDPHHWRYEKAQWVPYQEEEINLPGNQVYLHPDSPNTGAHWMKQEITFKRLKLTNSEPTAKKASHVILLHSLHKYRPRLHVEELGHGVLETQAASCLTHSFTFPETEFIAVTAYHNAEIIDLKICHNPFARAFRKESRSQGRLKAARPLGEAGADASAEAASDHASQRPLLQEGTRQDDDQGISIPGPGLQAPRPPLAQAAALAPSSPPSASAAAMPSETRQDAKASGKEGPTSRPQTSPEYRMVSLRSGPSKPLELGPGAQEKPSLQEPRWTHGSQTDWQEAALGERAPKKRCLSPRPSGSHGTCSVRANGEAQDLLLAALASSNITFAEEVLEDSGHPLLLKEANGPQGNNTIPVPCSAMQQPQPPWDYGFDSCHSSSNSSGLPPLQVAALNPGLQTSASPLALSYGLRQEGLLALLEASPFVSETCQGTSGDCRQSVPVPGAQEEPSLQEPIWPHPTQTELQDSALAERVPKRCLSPWASGRQAMWTGWASRQTLLLVALAPSAYTFSQSASEDSGHLLGVPEATAQDSRSGVPVPWNATQQPQPPLRSLFHSAPSSSSSSNSSSSSSSSLPSSEVVDMEPAWQPSPSPLAMPDEPRHKEALFSLLEAPICLSETSQGTSSPCLPSVPSEPTILSLEPKAKIFQGTSGFIYPRQSLKIHPRLHKLRSRHVCLPTNTAATTPLSPAQTFTGITSSEEEQPLGDL